MNAIRINKYNGKFGGYVPEPGFEKADVIDIEDPTGGAIQLDASMMVELTANDGTGVPTGRVFAWDLDSQSVAAIVGESVIDDLMDLGEFAVPENHTEIQTILIRSYRRLTRRTIPTDCTDPNTYQLFLGALLSETSMTPEEYNDILYGRLVGDFST